MARWEELAERNWGARREATYDLPGARAATRERILDAIARSAFDNLRTYSNCCRATLWALDTHLHVAGRDALRGTSALAGGIAGTGETCGAVLGPLLAIGFALGVADLTDLDADKAVREEGKRFVGRFRDLFGSTRCWEIQERIVGWRCDDPSKNDAWYAAGGGFACAAVCAEAARIAGAILLDARERTAASPDPVR
ncbi:MAG: C-GCAxxG-C-C family protein [Candidatus Bipolaricaulia bacterium]